MPETGTLHEDIYIYIYMCVCVCVFLTILVTRVIVFAVHSNRQKPILIGRNRTLICLISSRKSHEGLEVCMSDKSAEST